MINECCLNKFKHSPCHRTMFGSYRSVPHPGMLWAEETGIKQNKWQLDAQKPEFGAKPTIPLKRKCWKKDFGSTRGAE